VRELRAVRVSDDGKELLLTETGDAPQTGSSENSFILRADDRLRGLLKPRPSATDTRPESALSPREIQSRLRAGETAEDVARAAGIPVTRVARYEAPIAAERVRIVDEVRRASAPGPHRVSPGRQLGTIVDERLTDEGLDPALALWLARRRPDGTWLVTVDLADHHAEWSWDSGARRVRAQDGGAHKMVSPTRSSAESLIAVAQAAGVTTEAQAAAAAEPPAPLAPARAVGESMPASSESGSSRSTASSRSGFVVLPGEGAGGAAPAAARAEAGAPATLDQVPGASAPAPAAAEPAAASWSPSEGDVPGSGGSAGSSEPSASTSDAAESADEPVVRQAKSGKRRSAVPAWDDIVFGARRS
jgi:Protein of unknown function (DUF3071)